MDRVENINRLINDISNKGNIAVLVDKKPG